MKVNFRRLRFGLLQRVILPLLILPLKALLRTWRPTYPEQIKEDLIAAPRAVLVTYHGMFMHILAYAGIAQQRGRRLVVLISPSRDGRLLAAMLAWFGIEAVFGTSGSGGAVGARQFIARLAEGEIGVVAADGPRGPCCIAKSGALEIARLAGAQVFLAVTSARHGVTLGSWDRTHIPAPFSRIKLALQPFSTAGANDPAGHPIQDLSEDPARCAIILQAELLKLARAIASPVLPVAMRAGHLQQVPSGVLQTRSETLSGAGAAAKTTGNRPR